MSERPLMNPKIENFLRNPEPGTAAQLVYDMKRDDKLAAEVVYWLQEFANVIAVLQVVPRRDY